MQTFDYDVAVIGGGSAGYAAARTTASAGLKTVVVEGGPEVGGLCILRGCMPTKALLYAAEVLHRAKHPQPWGIRSSKVDFDFKRVMARKNALIKEFADYRIHQLNSGKFKFIRAKAKFLDANTVQLDSLGPVRRAGKNTISAKYFVVATGSAMAPPPLSQLNDIGFITSDDALTLRKLPKSLIVLGGGPTACEFAQFFSRFGVKVTQIQRSGHILHDFDPDAAEVVETVFRREGIRLFVGTKLLAARRKGRLKAIEFEHCGKTVSVAAEEILFALGRKPNTARLDLANAGIRVEDNGRIIANERMQTTAPNIFTAGDCASPYEIVHIAVQQGEVAGRNIIQAASAKMDYRLLISVVFTEPQAATVGLTEKTARHRGIPYIAATYPFNDHGKSLIMDAKDGFVKLLADVKTGEVLGGACVGPSAGELIHEIVAAMAKRMTAGELAAMPHYHPTLAEIWTYPAEEIADKISCH